MPIRQLDCESVCLSTVTLVTVLSMLVPRDSMNSVKGSVTEGMGDMQAQRLTMVNYKSIIHPQSSCRTRS